MTLFFNKKNIILLLFTTFLMISCSKDDDNDGENQNNVTLNNPVNDFVWGAMNSWYFWQESTADLADSKNDNKDDYHNYLNGFSSPQDLFDSLIFSQDDFSWFIDDYNIFLQSSQGITTSFGFSPLLSRIGQSDDLIMYIQYVTENSPAALAGFKRGDLINAINGTVMNINNYSSVLDGFRNDMTSEFSFTENDGITFKESKTITQSVVVDNPIKLTKVFDDISGKKVGYIVYNGFRTSYNDELNAAFGELKNAGIDELILDLRYNGGGNVGTCAFLASMIYDRADTNTTFCEFKNNSKKSDNDITINFSDELFVFDENNEYVRNETINRLSGIDQIYVLTTFNTASASELIISGLRPFIDVKIIGDTTVGKNEGSRTLFDSPEEDYAPDFNDLSRVNPDHTIAMQPIILQVFNSLGQSDYTDGFAPDILIEEWANWNNILPFGDENEIFLKTALDDIRGIAAKSTFEKTLNVQKVEKNIKINKFDKGLRLDNHYFK